MWYAVPSYSCARGSLAGGDHAPGCKVLCVTAFGPVSGSGVVLYSRRSRSHATMYTTQQHSSAARSTARALLFRKREHIQRSSRLRAVLQVLHGVDHALGGGLVARVELADHHRAGPAADAGQDRDVLVAVRTAIAHRLADDSAAGVELPFQRAVVRVDRLEPAVHGAVENQVAGSCERAAPQRQIFVAVPHLFARDRVPRDQVAPISARPREHTHIGA